MYILHFSFVLFFVGDFALFCFPLIFKNSSVLVELLSFNYGENLPQNETEGFSLHCLSNLPQDYSERLLKLKSGAFYFQLGKTPVYGWTSHALHKGTHLEVRVVMDLLLKNGLCAQVPSGVLLEEGAPSSSHKDIVYPSSHVSTEQSASWEIEINREDIFLNLINKLLHLHLCVYIRLSSGPPVLCSSGQLFQCVLEATARWGEMKKEGWRWYYSLVLPSRKPLSVL